jgi:hypothetical protein
MFLLDRVFVGGLRFVFDKIARAVDTELNDADRLRERLLDAQMRHELGELDDTEMAGIEGAILARLAELKRAEREETAALRVTGIDVSFRGDDEGRDRDEV